MQELMMAFAKESEVFQRRFPSRLSGQRLPRSW